MNYYLFKSGLSFSLILLLTACSSNPKEESPKYSKLSSEFREPPISSWPGVYWDWLNGDVTKSSITNDLEEMKKKGIGRAEIWDVAAIHNPDGEYGIGPEFLGDESVELIKYALSEGKRLDIEMGMIGSSGWNAGGTWVTPDWASKALYSSDFQLEGPKKFLGELPFPKVPEHTPRNKSGKPVFYEEVAVMAIPASSEKKIAQQDDIILLDAKFDGNMLHWDVPEGEWTILRFISSNTGQNLIVPSPESNGLMIDFLDPEATKRHLGHILDRLEITQKNAGESGLSYLEFDSMELDPATPWTNKMDSIFYSHHGMDIRPFLPVFAGWEISGGKEDFLYKFNKTVSDQLIYSHYTTGRDFLGQYGIKLVAEAGGPGPPIWDSNPVDALKALGNVSIPRGEFWLGHRNIFLIKEIASASNTYGLNLVDAEGFTTWRRWKDAPHDLKRHVDRAFCEGLNTITLHTFANTRPEHGLPGRAYHAGSDINPGSTWWEYARPFMDYLSRVSNLLTKGLFVADVAYYYGDKAPNFFPEHHDVPEKPGLKGLNPGNDYDIVNTDVLLNRMQVKNNRIVLPDGMSYELLVLPDRDDIPMEVKEKVENMIEKGAKVVLQGKGLPKEIKGNAMANMTIDNALSNLGITKDFTSESGVLDYIHRKDGNIDIYFVTNKSNRWINDTCTFRIENGEPELWNPVNSKQYQISNRSHVNNGTEIPLQLAPYESCFVIFDETDKTLNNLPDYVVKKIDEENTLMDIGGPWKVHFNEELGGPEQIMLDELESWTENSNQGVKYYSGTATYHQKINISSEEIQKRNQIYLDLGEVRDVAEVFINGSSTGILWTKPFALDVTELLEVGENDLRIDITNLWVNRLTLDKELPVQERITKTNVPYDSADYQLQESGLLGPVKLIFSDKNENYRPQ